MDGEVSHNDYYGQFVSGYIRERVVASIGADKIRASTDPHFNDIPLVLWDRVGFFVPDTTIKALREAGDVNANTPSNRVCIVKAAARQIKEG